MTVTLLQDMFLQPRYAVVCASALNAAVGVCDEGTLEKAVCVVVIKVVYYPIHEISSKYLTSLWLGYYETNRGLWLICSFIYLITQF